MNSYIIDKTCKFVEDKLSGDGSGHDWWHIFRVWTLAKKIAVEEKAQVEIVELGALLHDIADWKFHDGDDSIGPAIARKFLNNQMLNLMCQIPWLKLYPLFHIRELGSLRQ